MLCTLIETATVNNRVSSSTIPASVSEVKQVQKAPSIGESIQGIDIKSAVPGETAELSSTLLESDSAVLQTSENDLSTEQDDKRPRDFNYSKS